MNTLRPEWFSNVRNDLLADLVALGWVRAISGADKRSSPLIGALPLTAAPAVFPNLFLPDAVP